MKTLYTVYTRQSLGQSLEQNPQAKIIDIDETIEALKKDNFVI